MAKYVVLSCNADDKFAPVSMYLMQNKLSDVVAGIEKKAAELGAEVMYLLPEGENVDGLNGKVCHAMTSPSLFNPYAVAQVLQGNLPRPMIQDDYVAMCGEDEIAEVLTAEAAYCLATGCATRVVAVNKAGSTEFKEVALGTKLSEVADASDAKFVIIGGHKGLVVKPSDLANYEVSCCDELSSSISIYGADACVVDTVKTLMAGSHCESCGKCVLCREGTLQFKQITEEMTTGKAKMSDIDLIKDVGSIIEMGAYCPFGQNMPKPLISAIENFSEDFEEHIKRKSCKTGVCYKAEAVYIIMPDLCTGCGDCIDECPEEAIEGKAKFIHMIDQDMCEQCGKCVSACDEDAIVKWEDAKLPKLPKKLTKVGKF